MRIHTILSVSALSLFACCTKDSKAGATDKATPVAAEVVAKLEKADAADGKTDKVVSKCIGCGLKMDGQEKLSLKVSDYTLHMCDGCYDKFKADPAKAVNEMK